MQQNLDTWNHSSCRIHDGTGNSRRGPLRKRQAGKEGKYEGGGDSQLERSPKLRAMKYVSHVDHLTDFWYRCYCFPVPESRQLARVTGAWPLLGVSPFIVPLQAEARDNLNAQTARCRKHALSGGAGLSGADQTLPLRIQTVTFAFSPAATNLRTSSLARSMVAKGLLLLPGFSSRPPGATQYSAPRTGTGPPRCGGDRARGQAAHQEGSAVHALTM